MADDLMTTVADKSVLHPTIQIQLMAPKHQHANVNASKCRSAGDVMVAMSIFIRQLSKVILFVRSFSQICFMRC